jgi:hypothetical protein
MIIPNLLFRRPLEQANRNSRSSNLYGRFLSRANGTRSGDVSAEGDAEDGGVELLRLEFDALVKPEDMTHP